MCSGSTDVRESIHGAQCVRTCGSGMSDVSRASPAVNGGSREMSDSTSTYERSCGSCSCLIVVE